MSFNALSLEVNEMIGGFLSSNKDVLAFISVCKATNSTAESGLWRILFVQKFDLPIETLGNDTLKMLYQLRCRALSRTTNWMMGCGLNESIAFEILRDLVLTSYVDIPIGQRSTEISRNLLTIRGYAMRSNLLSNLYNTAQSLSCPGFETLKLVLAHVQLDLTLTPAAFGFSYSQKAVYTHPIKNPIFKGRNREKINIDFLTHTLNFFKYHLTLEAAQSVYRSFKGLKQPKKPRCWDTQIRQGLQPLGSHWYGTWATLSGVGNLVRQIRSKPVGSIDFIDTICENGFQTMTLSFDTAANTTPWSHEFEFYLRGMPRSTRKSFNPQRGIDYQQFSGCGIDSKDPFRCRGMLHPVVEQHGFPGWQRVTIMKHFPRHGPSSVPQSSTVTTSANVNFFNNAPPPPVQQINDDFDIDAECWAYEGAVLPGGKIMLGRWWHPLDDEETTAMGPFIFWEVQKKGSVILKT